MYILSNHKHGTLYIGVTSNLVQRIWQHKGDSIEGFSRKYALHSLVHFEMCQTMDAAIQREKQLKTWNRSWKIKLIETGNPNWNDLYPSIL